MSRFQLPKMNLNNYLPLRHPCGSHGYQLVLLIGGVSYPWQCDAQIWDLNPQLVEEKFEIW